MSVPDIAMNTAAEISVNESHKQHNKYLLSLLIVIVLMVTLCFLWLKFLQPQVLPIKHVKVEGQFLHLKPEKLKTLSANIVRGGFFNVNVDVIREHLLAEPWVHSVTVRRVWPDTLVLYVNEQLPVSSWNNHSLINEEGLIFDPEISSIPPDLPALSGPEGTHSELLTLLDHLDSELRAHKLHIVQLSMDARRSLSFTLNNGTVAKIGNKDIETRIERFLQYVPMQINKNLADISVIDMRYTNGFSVKTKAIDEIANRKE